MEKSSNLLKKIEKNSLLELVPGLKELIISEGNIKILNKGARLVKKQDNLEELIIPITGPLLLKNQSEDKKSKSNDLVTYLRPGRALALNNLLLNKVIEYDVIAEENVFYASLNKNIFNKLINSNKELKHFLILISASEALRGFRKLLEDEQVEYKNILKIFSCISEDPIEVKEGLVLEKYHQIYFINQGKLRITPVKNSNFSDSMLGAGQWFGGRSLVAPKQWGYTATAETGCEFHILDHKLLEAQVDEIIIEKIYNEPHLTEAEPAGIWTEDGSLSKSYGREINKMSLLQAGLKFDPAKLRRCKTDKGSVIASIINIGLFRGQSVNISNIQSYLSKYDKVSLLRIAEALDPYGLIARPIQSKYEDLPKRKFPLLCFFNNRLCVLLKHSKLATILIDPAIGFVNVKAATFKSSWTGEILEVEGAATDHIHRTEDVEQANDEPVNRLNLKRTQSVFFKLIQTQSQLIYNLIFVSLIGFLLSLITPLFYQEILDEVLTLRDKELVFAYISGIIIVTFFMVLVAVTKSLILAEFSTRYDARLSSAFYRHTLSLPARSHSKERVGEVLAQLMEIWNIRKFLSGSSVSAIIDTFSIIIFGSILFYYSWKVGLTAIALFVGIILVRLLFKSKLQKNYLDDYETTKSTNSLMTEQISSIGTIKASGAENLMREKWEQFFLKGVIARRNIQMTAATLNSFNQCIAGIARLSAIWLSCNLALSNELSAGQIVAISMYFDKIMAPIGSLSSLFSEYEQVKVSCKKLATAFSKCPEQTTDEAKRNYAITLKGRIRFDKVYFKYPGSSKNVLENVSFTIYPNQVVALVGRSGCGKTTIANLIAGEMHSTSGSIYFDDYDRSILSSSSLRQHIGYVMQNNQLFGGTIAQNIALADDAPVSKEIIEAAKKASAADFISKFPAGYDHYLGEGGLGLSGGQKQRISIARTLYRNPQILIMDEATSALDAESERAIVSNMRNILNGRTAIIIAHRLSTIRSADRILVMHEGSIVEDGTHSQLLNSGGYYSDLFQNQLNSEAS